MSSISFVVECLNFEGGFDYNGAKNNKPDAFKLASELDLYYTRVVSIKNGFRKIIFENYTKQELKAQINGMRFASSFLG